MSKTKPIITIGICVRNCENFLSDTINSLIEQDFPHELMEIVFVDDGSEDRTLQIIKEHVSRINIRAKVFHTKWMGLGPARQLALNNAEGKYILWVDGDETLSKSYVRQQVDFMEKHPEVGITSGVIEAFGKSFILNLELVPFKLNHMLFEEPKSFFWKTKKFPGTGGTTFRVEALQQINGFDKSFTGAGEDMDVAKRIEKTNWAIKLNNAVFYEKKMNMSSIVDLWKKYFWYGYGSQTFYRKDRTIVILSRMTPPAGFFAGFFYSILAYKLMRNKRLFLLPFFFSFKMTAWCLGFMKSQIVNVYSRN